MAKIAASKIVQVSASSVAIGGGVLTTVVALLDDGNVVYTGIAGEPEWHLLPPVPPLSELD